MNEKLQAEIIAVLMVCVTAGMVFFAVSMIFEVGPLGRLAQESRAQQRETFWRQREAKYLAVGFRVERMVEHDSLVLIRADGERFLVTFLQGETSSASVVPLSKQTPEEAKP